MLMKGRRYISPSWEGVRWEGVWLEGVWWAGKPTVLLLHGFCAASSFWTDTAVPFLPRSFLEGRRVVAVDLLGWGKSPKPRDCDYSIEEHVSWIERTVLAPLGISTFHIVGHSMGGLIGAVLAARNRHRVLSLCLYSPPFIPPRPGLTPAEEFFQQVAPRCFSPALLLCTSMVAWFEHVGRVICALFTQFHWLSDPLAALLLPRIGAKLPPSYVRDFSRCTHHTAWHSFFNTICAGTNFLEPSLHLLHNLSPTNVLATSSGACNETKSASTVAESGKLYNRSVPVTIVHGDKDKLCPIESSRGLARRHPNVKLLEVRGVDHITVVLGREKEAAQQIVEFVEEAEAASMDA
ncbi:unnamed protein product [Closterium sp. Yama58-4]|nr:unnamed protein product [Closterium sp. Yama58-4]